MFNWLVLLDFFKNYYTEYKTNNDFVKDIEIAIYDSNYTVTCIIVLREVILTSLGGITLSASDNTSSESTFDVGFNFNYFDFDLHNVYQQSPQSLH